MLIIFASFILALPLPGSTGGPVAAAEVSHLAFVSQPFSAAVGASVGTVMVEVQDDSDEAVTTDQTTLVTLSAQGGSGALTCTGGLTRRVVDGTATFIGCTLSETGNYTLHATSSPALPADSNQFTMTAPPGPTGLLRVTTSPGVPSQVQVNGVPMDDWALNWVKLPAGTYTVSFSDLLGFTTPVPETVTVTAGQVTTVQGTFVQRGNLRVVTSPPVPSTISVDGMPRNDWGLWTDLPTGSYEVCFGAVQGFNAPSCQQANLVAGQTTVITGTFTANGGAPGPAAGFGLLRVQTSPAVPSQIEVNGVPMTDWGLDWVKLAPGTYTVSFGNVSNFTSPPPQAVTVTAGQTTVVTGTFIVRGFLRVITSPPVPGTIVVNGLPREDWGMWTSVEPGSYTVCFGLVVGFTAPTCQTQNVSTNSLSTFTGSYLVDATDTDGDGLTDLQELAIGTSVTNVDTDCDYVSDFTEVSNPVSPTDTDGDGRVNAVESSLYDSDGDGNKDDAAPGSGPQVGCARFFPFAIIANGVDASRLEVRVEGSNVSSVWVQSPFFTYDVRLDGLLLSSNQQFQLYDDGSHGDLLAGDKTWTRAGFTSSDPDATRDFVFFNLVIVNTTSGEAEIELSSAAGGWVAAGAALGIVGTGDVATIQSVSPGFQAASNSVAINAPLLSLDLKRVANIQEVAKKFYEVFDDDYDFVLFLPDRPTVSFASGVSFTAQNNVQNVGQSVFNNSSFYGSAGRLQSAIYLNMWSNGPTLHEIMHRWAAFGLSGLGFHQCANAHWGVAGIGRGQLGGFDPATLVNNGNGTFTVGSFGTIANGGDSVPYAPLELYLMGLLDISQVPNVTIPTNVNCGSLTFQSGTITFAASGLTTVTPAQIQAAFGGPRSPGVGASQTAFNAAMVIVTDRELTASEMTFVNTWAKRLGDEPTTGWSNLRSFANATGGRATMNTHVDFP